MGTKCTGLYKGNLLVETTHELSEVILRTDAPVDNSGTRTFFLSY